MKSTTTARFAVWAILSLAAYGKDTQVKGLITGRSGATLILQTSDVPKLTVLLTDNTQVDEAEGLFKFRKKRLGLTALIPGLPIEVQGAYNAQNQLVASTVKFKGSDLQAAEDIQAGVAATAQKAQANQQQIQQQKQALQQEQQQLSAEKRSIASNQAAIAAANKRFGELGDYNILDETSIFFGNGQTAVEQKYKPELLELAHKAIGINGFMIQVQGYASKIGSAALNQKLSQERADNVLDFLEQDGKIPLTNMLAPGAMGTSNQIGSDATAEGQAENRRVVVRILQNKGIAGN